MEKMMKVGKLDRWMEGWRKEEVGEAVQWWHLGRNSGTRRHETLGVTPEWPLSGPLWSNLRGLPMDVATAS